MRKLFLLVFWFISTQCPLVLSDVYEECEDLLLDESHLPVYLRDIKWMNVEAELKKDLRLSPFVRPIFYDITLNASVYGYNNANFSTFEGTVMIDLEISGPVHEIELNSVGLTIKNASLYFPSGERYDKFSINWERESIIFTTDRLILPWEEAKLKIEYSGRARMNGEGLYESWNKRENSNDGPYISLVTQCEPTSARRWFPCFDEPDKKARFQLTVHHPEETNAYSNTRTQGNETANGIRMTKFAKTVPLPTYLVALALTEQPVEELTVDGYEFRAIGHNRKGAVKTVAAALKKLRNYTIFDGVAFLPEKTDILVVEDYDSGAMENPGLITINKDSAVDMETHVHELAHQYFGNLVTLSTWGDIWVNEGFATFYDSDLEPRSDFADLAFGAVSLHDAPIHSERTFTSSVHISNYFNAHAHIHYKKAAQVLRMIRKFVGGDVFDRLIKRYLLDNEYKNGDAAKIINTLLKEYKGDFTHLQKILYEWIYQPGVAIIFMERDENGVKLRQTRYHSTYFDEQLRDEKTRYTIPLFCTIDGVSQTIVFDSRVENLTISLASNSTFVIENNYGALYGVWSKLKELPENVEEIVKWVSLTISLVRSGMLTIDEFYDTIAPFLDDSDVQWHLRNLIGKMGLEEEDSSESQIECSPGDENATLSDLFPRYLKDFNVGLLFCSGEAKIRNEMYKLLARTVSFDLTKIKSEHLSSLVSHIERLHPGIAMEVVNDEMLTENLFGRAKISSILQVVHRMETLSGSRFTIQRTIRDYPKGAAENSDVILQILEKIYIREERKKKNQAMIIKLGAIFETTTTPGPTSSAWFNPDDLDPEKVFEKLEQEEREEEERKREEEKENKEQKIPLT